MKCLKNIFTPLCCITILFFAVYLPYIFHGGFIIDDWGVAYQAHNKGSFLDIYKSWFPLFSNRPLAPFPITLVALLYDLQPLGYIITHLCLWGLFLSLTTRVLYCYLGQYAYLFFILGLFPVVSSTVIFSPGMQLVASVSFSLWAIAFNILNFSKKTSSRLTAYLLLLTSLLVYEITFPLLILSWFVSCHSTLHKKKIRHFLLSCIPYVTIVFMVTVYQKVIIPNIMITHSRLHLNEIKSFLNTFWRWLKALFCDLPIMLGDSFSRIFTYNHVELFTLVAICLLGSMFFFVLGSQKGTQHVENKNFLLISLLTFFASSLLYILSGAYPDISGYNNRGMTCSWIALSIFIPSFLCYFRKIKCLLILASIIYFFIICSFIIQRDQQIIASEYQHIILQDFKKTIQESGYDLSSSYVLANIPANPPDAFNNEVIFNVPWDFPFAVQMYFPNLVKSSAPVNPQMIASGYLKVDGNDVAIFRDKFPIANLYYYQYSIGERKSTLEYIGKVEQVQKIIDITTTYEHWKGVPSWKERQKAFF